MRRRRVERYTVPICDLVKDAIEHARSHPSCPPEAQTAEALCAFLCAHGVKAEPADDGTAVTFQTRTVTAYGRFYWALVCTLMGAIWNAQAVEWVGRANTTSPNADEIDRSV